MLYAEGASRHSNRMNGGQYVPVGCCAGVTLALKGDSIEVGMFNILMLIPHSEKWLNLKD